MDVVYGRGFLDQVSHMEMLGMVRVWPGIKLFWNINHPANASSHRCIAPRTDPLSTTEWLTSQPKTLPPHSGSSF